MHRQATYVTTREFTQRLDNTRANEARIEGLQGFQAANIRQKASHRSEVRVESKRRMKRFQQQNEEMLTGYAIDQQQAQSAEKKMLREQDERMAAAMYDTKQQKEAEDSNVRRICEESEELKVLKEKLTQAKISKVRSQQLQERALLERQQESKQAQMDYMMEEDRRQAVEQEYEEAQRKLFLNIQSKRTLQNQIASREIRKAEAYEAFLREKAMVDEIVKGIEAEDRAKMAEGRRIQDELQGNIKDYLEERKAWREAEQTRTEEELRKIEEYNAIKKRQHAELIARKRKVADGQDEILRKLTKEIEEKRKQEEEMRLLLDELYQEEAEQKALERMEEDSKKRLMMKNEMMEANVFQIKLKAEQERELAIEEQRFRDEMMARFETDRRLELMNEDRRRREMVSYKKEVERLIEERREQYRKAVEAEYEDMRIQDEQAKFRAAVVERERQRLLREHASELGGYLPKGVLKNDEDYQVVYGQNVRSPRAPQDFSRNDQQTNPITGRPVSTPRRGGAGAGNASPNSRDSLDHFAINNRQGNTQGSRQGSRQGNRPPSGGDQQGNRPPSGGDQWGSRPGSGSGRRPQSRSTYAYDSEKGPSDRPF